MNDFSDVGYITVSVSVGDVISPHTISIHVVITSIPLAVAVSVPLVRVLHHATVVTGISVAVLIGVLLVHVGL